MSASDYLEGQIIAHFLRTNSWTKPAALYMALFTVVPSDDGTGGTEVSTTDTGYARVAVGPGDAYWDAPTAAGLTANTSDVTFPTPTGSTDWGTVQGAGIYDASSGGNLLFIVSVATPRAVLQGDPAPKFLAGDFTITVT